MCFFNIFKLIAEFFYKMERLIKPLAIQTTKIDKFVANNFDTIPMCMLTRYF